MANPPIDKPSIEKTLKDQHRLTMNVVNAIKSNTETLMTKTDQIVEHLVEEETQQSPGVPPTDMPPHQPEPPAPPQAAMAAPSPPQPSPQTGAPGQGFGPGINPRDGEFLVAEISRLCVNEVMQTINPILEALNTFIKANGLGTASPSQQETEDELFAEKLIEQMKQAVSRRQKIAMARMKRTAP